MLQFTKMEGCGNDFLVVDLRHGKSALASSDRDAVVALCDRHFGVGADGVLAIEPASQAGAVARMRVLNADGSEAEMCGNGIRCVAKFLYERASGERRPTIAIETGAGVLDCGVTIDGKRCVTHVAVAMGRPRLRRSEIPMVGPDQTTGDERVIDRPIELRARDGKTRTFRMSAVSMGNPHAVIFVDGDESLRALAEQFGPSLEHHAWFPARTNAEFARRKSEREIELVVWERGCGITLACGTGACATAVAACLTERAKRGQEIAVHLLGGTLHITVADGGAIDQAGVTMRGPADEVYEAEIDVAALAERRRLRAVR